MRRIDCFLYDGEHEMLMARVRELRGVVDAHVIVTANRTHQGDVNDELPAITTELLETAGTIVPGEEQRVGPATLRDYDRYEGPEIVVYQIDLSSHDHRGRGGAGTPDYQQRERAHRDGAVKACEVLSTPPEDDDLILVSDVDEIPSRFAVRDLDVLVDERHPLLVMRQRMHCFALDWLYPGPWLGTTVTRWRDACGELSPQRARDLRGDERVPSIQERAGWHLTWMGGPAAAIRKQTRFSHAELNDREHSFAWHREHGIDSNGVQCQRVDDLVLLGDWPSGLLAAADARPDYWRAP